MTKINALSAGIIILSAAIAGPVFAQDVRLFGPTSYYYSGWDRPPGPYYYRSCIQGPGFGRPCPGPLYGWSIGRDRSRVGGVEPSLRPAGN